MSGPLILLKAVDYSGSGPWLDETVNNNDATLENGTAAKNAAGNGIVLNGSTNWTFPNVAAANAWTVNVWYKNTGAPVGNAGSVITQKYSNPSFNINIGYNPDNIGNFGVGFYNDVWYNGTEFSSTITANLNNWLNIQATWDGSTIKTYINGILIGSASQVGTAADSGLAYRIGRRWDSADYVTGEIGEVRIYNYPLTQSQVRADYLSSYNTFIFNPALISGCQMWLDGTDSSSIVLSGSSITQWNDKSGLSNNATAVGSVTYSNNLAVFDGSTGYFKTPYTAHQAAESVFVVYSTNNSSLSLQSLVDSSAAGGRQFGSVSNPSGPSLANNTIEWLLYGNYSITSGTTYIAECLYNTSGINILVTGNTSASNARNPALTSGKTLIGAGYFGTITWFLNGTISEVLIYNKSLTTFERQVVEGYLAWKWGIQSQLPNSHRFYNYPPPVNVLDPLVLLKAIDYTSGTWNDETGNGFNATLENGTAAKNWKGNGLVLDGSTSWTFPNVAVGNSWTASVWFKNTGTPTGSDSGAGAAVLTQRFDGSIQAINLNIGYSNDSASSFLGFFITSGPVYNNGSPITLTNGAWINIQLTWDGTNLTTYINGTLLGITTPANAAIDNGLAYRIGRRWDISAADQYIVGDIGEVRIYNYPLTQTQVTADYNSSVATFATNPTLMVLLKAINYTSGTWLDESGLGFNATLENGTAAKNAAGNGLVLDGSTNWTFPNVEVVNAWTASVWYKNTGAPIGTNACILTQINGIMNLMIGYVDSLSGGFYNGSTGWSVGNTITLIDNVWTNIQVTWDGHCMTTYINGKFLGITEPGGTAIDSGEAYRIGRRWDSADYMVGEIGEVRIYNYPITQAKVTADYNASASTFQNLLVLLKAVDYTSGTWTDQSAYGFNATLENGTATKNTAGNGLVLNGSTNWTFPNVAAGPRWTASVWYKNTGSPGDSACILTQIFTGSSINVAIGYLEGGLLTGGFYQGPWRVGNQITLTNGDWTNIQVTWDGTNLSTYINATLLGTTRPGGLSPDSGNAYRIGRRWDNPDYMTGEIGEVRIYNYPLTQDQVSTVYYDSFETFYSPSVPTAPRIHIRPKVSSQTIRLNWVAPIYHDGTPYHYVISCPQDINAPYDPISSTATQFTITGLTNGTQYTYSIKAVNSHGNGPTATYRTVRPGPKAPPLTTAVAIKTGANTATITNVYNTGLTSYYIGWSVAITNHFTDCGLPYKNATIFGNNTIYVNNNSIPNNLDLTNDMYTFSMSYINDSGYSTAVKTNPIGNVQYTLTNPSNTYPYIGSAFTSVASDVSGQKLVACAKNGGYIWTSTNRGDTWVQRAGADFRSWISVASSANGTKLIAADQGGSVWTSGDSGVTWTERPAVGPSPQTWSYVAISANGTYALASAGVPGVANGYIYWSGDSGATWTQTGAPQRNDWTSLTVSDNGATLYATGVGQYYGPIYKSTNSGTTWSLVPFTGTTVAFYAIAGSSDGTKLIIGDNAGGTGIWTSTNTGISWTNNTSYLQGQIIGATGAVVSSDSGVNLAVVANGSIWTSGDSGATWTQETTPTGTNLRIACDASGTTIYAVGDGDGSTGMYLWKGVYTTSWSWTQILISADLSGNTTSNFGAIACSKNGQYVYLAITNLPIWKSSNYGATWAEISGSPTITYTGNAGVTCSDDGSIVMIFQYSVHVSSNYGVTWNANAPNLGALAGVVRSTKLVAGSESDGIYVSTNGGDTWTNYSANDYGVGRALTMSTNGLVIAGAASFVSVSTDGGTNWYTHPGGGSWDTIRVSADLTKLVVMNGLIFFSIDSGVSWKILLTAGLTTWTSIWVSADFTKMAATTNGGSIRYSTDSGATWADGASTGGKLWTGITGDSTGQYLTAVVDSGSIWFSRDYGASWYSYANPGTGPWTGMAISADATTMVAGAVTPYITNNGGADWRVFPLFPAGTSYNFSTFISANNTFIAVAINEGTNYIWTSSDSGYSWTKQTGSGSRTWIGIAGSSNGSILYAQEFAGQIYKSTDYGVTWTVVNSGKYWNGIACDSTGTYVAAVVGASGVGSIWTSDNSGTDWTERTTGPGQQTWSGIASDPTGQRLAACTSGGGYIWTSSDYGATWTQSGSPSADWTSISCSAYGNNIIASAGGGLWTSSDFGTTWGQHPGTDSTNWFSVASSANARTIIATNAGYAGNTPVFIGRIQ